MARPSGEVIDIDSMTSPDVRSVHKSLSSPLTLHAITSSSAEKICVGRVCGSISSCDPFTLTDICDIGGNLSRIRHGTRVNEVISPQLLGFCGYLELLDLAFTVVELTH